MQNNLKLICSFHNFVLIGRHQPDKRMTNLGQRHSNIVNISKFKYCQYSQHITFKIQILSTYCQHSIFQSKKKELVACAMGLGDNKGRMASPKQMNFRKFILRISRQNCDKSAYVHYGGTVVYYMILFPIRCM